MSVCRECGLEITFRIKNGVCIPIHASGKWCEGPAERTRAIRCPKCLQIAYYVEHNGGFAWFDELGPPWSKHPCFDFVTPNSHAQADKPLQQTQRVAPAAPVVESTTTVRDKQRRTLCGVCKRIFNGSYADHVKAGHKPPRSVPKGQGINSKGSGKLKKSKGIPRPSTIHVDRKELYEQFLAEIPRKGNILDIACGTGRDTSAFRKMGYKVVLIDAVSNMVEATSKLTGQSAFLVRFDEFAFENEFDGVWASGSLLHVSRADLALTFSRIARVLRQDGVLYTSFKHGDSERIGGTRFFNDMNEPLLRQCLDKNVELQPFRIWTTEDARPERRGEKWLNVIVRKTTQ